MDHITHDFGLDKLSDHGQHKIYGGLRGDIWHFIHLRDEGQVSHMMQRHVPRFIMARAVDSIAGKIPPDDKSVVMTHDSRRAGICLMPDGKIAMVVGQSMHAIPDAVGKSFGQDVEMLHESWKDVVNAGGQFSLPGAQTFSGNPVSYPTPGMIHAIALEKRQRGYLDAREFGIYSAYCTWRDFIDGKPEKVDQIASGMAEDLSNWNANDIGNKQYWESVLGIQDQLFSERIWGPDIDTDYDTVYASMHAILSRLSSIGFAQFNLFCGMQPGGPFHPLALLAGMMELDEFNYWRCLGYQDDSEEEQDIRTQNAFIALLGALG